MLPVCLCVQITADKLTQTAAANWSAAARAQLPAPPPFSPDLVKTIYNDELGGGSGASRKPSLKRVMVLEISQYLESYLWPHFDAEGGGSSFEHVMSIMLMVNEKFRENVPPWACFHTRKVRGGIGRGGKFRENGPPWACFHTSKVCAGGDWPACAEVCACVCAREREN